ncbi:hypothetical protein ACFYW9_34325 [Streptomyces sp. NPDC002698]|uniref:hypothetical protein n=1 Tax=Streptomyces sp. NPDC002698 TaxID=3364660 RepID=UPI003693C36F
MQNRFVDDPRDAVHTADALVADVMQRLAATFADREQELEGQWNRGEYRRPAPGTAALLFVLQPPAGHLTRRRSG